MVFGDIGDFSSRYLKYSLSVVRAKVGGSCGGVDGRITNC